MDPTAVLSEKGETSPTLTQSGHRPDVRSRPNLVRSLGIERPWRMPGSQLCGVSVLLPMDIELVLDASGHAGIIHAG
jgi:hypothetical protein